jgi:hypothetical protein
MEKKFGAVWLHPPAVQTCLDLVTHVSKKSITRLCHEEFLVPIFSVPSSCLIDFLGHMSLDPSKSAFFFYCTGG